MQSLSNTSSKFDLNGDEPVSETSVFIKCFAPSLVIFEID